MSKKTSIEAKILEAAYRLFLQKGYRHTTMDDIAQDLGMSKKTLYKYYPGKLELLSASFEVLKTKMTAKVEAILDNRYISFPLKLKSTLTVIAAHLAPINPELFEDLRDHAPEIWEELTAYINESAYLRFAKLIEQGVSQGLVNPRINVNLIVLLYAAAVQSLLDPKFYSQFPDSMQKGMKIPPSDIYDQAISIIYNGILTDEARNEFQNA
ncbi:MAG: TetR/AcrR family transcriptional regulator [Algoriphagus sp.]|jgi:AcrR family transcriptional regulator|uniref:TetR/AcrR family transcriptional regulator n=1 Tax=Algoriphagus sp. TaxID=1872435 RepID=UPI00271A7A14|nr:TetR/AcrR family transcriptional regulator [Algoriphagus sp.]MDO8966971.1 TetR/AcrR family transcriptional regulator [Algoriphagus sp.]MDP2042574.1 TetR/AcrR family transcriptional regulator [Algoriphagus sp.]MDP3199535.1 TetR/AcrR family transcriptional regulator [Algoriphagus sp.]MDP3472729.1 TetR/AcrR family transcriptional regulator [Algoriphagus sp.]